MLVTKFSLKTLLVGQIFPEGYQFLTQVLNEAPEKNRVC